MFVNLVCVTAVMYNIYVHNLSNSIQQWIKFHGGLKPVVPVILQDILKLIWFFFYFYESAIMHIPTPTQISPLFSVWSWKAAVQNPQGHGVLKGKPNVLQIEFYFRKL